MDEPIPVKPYPIRPAFASLEAAVAQLKSHPRLPDAMRDAELLTGSHLVDAWWTLHEWGLRFDSGLCLRVWPEGAEVDWQLMPSGNELAGTEVRRVGSPPVRLRWPRGLGIREMDCSALIANRRGSYFHNMLVSGFGLFLYFQGHPVLQFHAVHCETDGRSLLHVYADD
jgi:hypothetical protein